MGLLERIESKVAFRRKYRTFINLVRFGTNHPRPNQLIYICTICVKQRSYEFTKRDSGRVLRRNEEIICFPLFDSGSPSKALEEAYEQVVRGKTWEYENLSQVQKQKLFSKGYNQIDIKTKYENLNHLKQLVSETKEMPRSLSASGLFEFDGIRFHIGSNGQPIFAGGGSHRLAIAIALKINRVPGELGVIHRNAVGLINWRKNPSNRCPHNQEPFERT